MQIIEPAGNPAKQAWGPGPWQDEPDKVQWYDEETGLPCMVIRNMHGGHLCGYVGVYPGHPLHKVDYSDTYDHEIRAHGGLTFSDECAGRICHVPKEGEPHPVWWFGFDCGHHNDESPGTRAALARFSGIYHGGEYRDLDYVRGFCRSLAEDLSRVQHPADPEGDPASFGAPSSEVIAGMDGDR